MSPGQQGRPFMYAVATRERRPPSGYTPPTPVLRAPGSRDALIVYENDKDTAQDRAAKFAETFTSYSIYAVTSHGDVANLQTYLRRNGYNTVHIWNHGSMTK